MDLTSSRNSYPAFFLSFFFFQPCASRWSLGFLFFCFLLVPKSLLCCSRCFGPVLVYVRSCLICSFTLFHLFTRKAINLVNLVKIDPNKDHCSPIENCFGPQEKLFQPCDAYRSFSREPFLLKNRDISGFSL